MGKCRVVKQAGAIALATLMMGAVPALGMAKAQSEIDPVTSSNGYFVDHYQSNDMDHMNPESNAVINVLSAFLKIWQPGEQWNSGTKIGAAGNLVLNRNIQICEELTGNRTMQQELTAYLIDRRNQNYSALEGLGSDRGRFQELTEAATSLSTEIPADATTVKYKDTGNQNGNWAEADSPLGSVVTLVDTFRGPKASGNPAKIYFQYMRPFRWSEQVKLLPALQPCVGDPETDGGFPSGHTNAAYLASLALAYAAPEHYQECLLNASEIGNYRIVAGMHSPTDIIGGRTMATAIAAATLNDTQNDSLKNAARQEAVTYLQLSVQDSDSSEYRENKRLYEERLTYGLPQTGDTTKAMIVPKGAEALLETRFPYLDASQQRWILYTTGLPSGYEFLDDAEGWGRLNLFAATGGYGAFPIDVTVTMNAYQGGLHQRDIWQNDISGAGSLTKQGTGMLVLAGNNSYTGGTHLYQGGITLAGREAAGLGVVQNFGGTLVEQVSGPVALESDFVQGVKGVLQLNISSADDVLLIAKKATLGGTLKVHFDDYQPPAEGMILIRANQIEGTFTSVEVTGLEENMEVVINGADVCLQKK